MYILKIGSSEYKCKEKPIRKGSTITGFGEIEQMEFTEGGEMKFITVETNFTLSGVSKYSLENENGEEIELPETFDQVDRLIESNVDLEYRLSLLELGGDI